MTSEIRVTLIHRAGYRFIEARWIDPVTGRKKTRSTKCVVRRDAERFAARLEEKLRSGRESGIVPIKWSDACKAYADEVFPHQSAKSSSRMRTVWKFVEETVGPTSLAVISEQEIGQIVAALQQKKLSAYTIQSYLSKLRTFFDWAVARRYLQAAPKTSSPIRGAAPERGRAITREEFDRMLKAVAKVVPKANVKAWRRLLIGLWLSGLRLDEALRLTWHDGLFVVDVTGRIPMFRIEAAGQKNRQYALAPMVQSFWRFLEQTPERDRRGYVFKAPGERNARVTLNTASAMICQIGEKARIKVSKGKFASAQDLRRSFGDRWSNRVKSITLMRLMRHKSISTTEKFYARRDAETVAAELWNTTRAVGNGFGNASNSEQTSPPAGTHETP